MAFAVAFLTMAVAANARFGTITSTSVPNRVVQLGLHLFF
jgi:hypothetical protein